MLSSARSLVLNVLKICVTGLGAPPCEYATENTSFVTASLSEVEGGGNIHTYLLLIFLHCDSAFVANKATYKRTVRTKGHMGGDD